MIDLTNVEKKRELMLTGNLWKTLLLISLPVALSGMVIEIFALFDVYFSSILGKSEMAATVFVGPIQNVIAAIGVGFGVAATSLISREIGKKQFNKGKNILSQMVLISFIVAIILVVFGVFFSKQILRISGAKGTLLETANVYFKIIVCSFPFKFFNNIYIGKERAVGNNRLIMVINIVSIILKFLISFLLIVILNFDIIGLGISTLIADAFITLFGIYFIFFKKTELQVNSKSLKFDYSVIWMILIFSFPIIIEKSTQSLGNAIINSYAAGLGDDVLTAYGIINRINSVIFSFSSGFGVALVSIVGQNIAVKNYSRIKEAKVKGIILSLSIVTVLLVCILSIKQIIAGFYAKDDVTLLDNILKGMNVYTISAIPWTIMHIYFGIFQGMKKTIYVLIVSLARLWIFRVLLVGILIKFTNMGANAIWYGMLISNILALVVSLIIYYIKCRKVFDNPIMEI